MSESVELDVFGASPSLDPAAGRNAVQADVVSSRTQAVAAVRGEHALDLFCRLHGGVAGKLMLTLGDRGGYVPQNVW